MLSSNAATAALDSERGFFPSSRPGASYYPHSSFSSVEGPARASAVPDGDLFSSSSSNTLSSSLPVSGPTPSLFLSSSPSTFRSYSAVRTRENHAGGVTSAVPSAAATGTRAPVATTAAATVQGVAPQKTKAKTKSATSIFLPSRDKFQPAAGPLQYLQTRSPFLYTPSFVAPLPSVPLAPKFCAYTLRRSAICGATSSLPPAAAVAAATQSKLIPSSSDIWEGAFLATAGDNREEGTGRIDVAAAAAAAAPGDVTIYDVAASRQLLQTFDAAGLLVNLINPKGYPQLLEVPPPSVSAGATGINTREEQQHAALDKTTSSFSTLPAYIAALPPEDLDLVAGVLPECAAYHLQQQQHQKSASYQRKRSRLKAFGAATAAAAAESSSSSREQRAAVAKNERGLSSKKHIKLQHTFAAAGEHLKKNQEANKKVTTSHHARDAEEQAQHVVYRHPTKPHLRPKRILTVVPCRQLCGSKYLQVGLDLPRNELEALAAEEEDSTEADRKNDQQPGKGLQQEQQQQQQERLEEQQQQQQQEQEEGQMGETIKKRHAPPSLLLLTSASSTLVSYAYYMKVKKHEQLAKRNEARQLSPSLPLLSLSPVRDGQQRCAPADERNPAFSKDVASSSRDNSSKEIPNNKGVVAARYRFARDYICQLSRKEGTSRGEKTFLLILPRNNTTAVSPSSFSSFSSQPECLSSLSTCNASALSGKFISLVRSPAAAGEEGAAGEEAAAGVEKEAVIAASGERAAAGEAETTAPSKEASSSAVAARRSVSRGSLIGADYAYVVPLHAHKRILTKAGSCVRRNKIRLLLRQPSEKENELSAESRTAWLGESPSPAKPLQRISGGTDGEEEEVLADSSAAAAAVAAIGVSSVAGAATTAEEESSDDTSAPRHGLDGKDDWKSDQLLQEKGQERRNKKMQENEDEEDTEIASKRTTREPLRSRGGESTHKNHFPSKKHKSRATAAGKKVGDRNRVGSNTAAGTATTEEEEEAEPQLFEEDNGADENEDEEEEEREEKEDEEEDEEEEEEQEEEEDEEGSSSSGSASSSSSSSKSDDDDD